MHFIGIYLVRYYRDSNCTFYLTQTFVEITKSFDNKLLLSSNNTQILGIKIEVRKKRLFILKRIFINIFPRNLLIRFN